MPLERGREKKKRSFLTADIDLLALPQAAHADEASGLYVGAGAGQKGVVSGMTLTC